MLFQHHGFTEVAFEALDTETYTGVGVNRLIGASAAALPDDPLFTFTR